ncbi:hypothetical protein [Methanosarcina virus MetMV]|jgi:hypothetical protein|nr:hypothetical protein [Methanosarcina virus MetMV]
MESLRRQYGITLEEEDKLAARVEAMFKGLFELRFKENTFKLVEDFLNRRNFIEGDELVFSYVQKITYTALIGLLGEIRNGKEAEKKKLKKSKGV